MKKQIALNILKCIVDVLLFLAISFYLVFILFKIVYFRSPVYGFSMKPTLNATVPDINTAGDVAFVNRFKAAKTGDVVVAQVNWSDKEFVIKRLIAVAGDSIEVTPDENGYSLKVNDVEICYKQKNTATDNFYDYFLAFIGNSVEGKDFSNNIQGNKIVLNKGECFLLGDNWGESRDCLMEGAIKTEQILGCVDFVAPYKTNANLTIIKYMFVALFCPLK